ncbi:MAG: ABC transporter permease [Spirochaetales bacterium]|nr:ABC transporter permease [Spirochaetales bacterium]
MNEFFAIFNVELLHSTIRLSTPITLAAIGATICERAGIVNIAMEGLMLIGAFAATFFAYVTGNPWIGLIGGVIAGGLFSLLHAYATVTLHMDHVVSGAVLNILALGLTSYLLILAFGRSGTSDPIPVSLAEYEYAIPLLSGIPVIGQVLFHQRPIVYISFILIIFFTLFLYRAKKGLHIRASGEHPLALETIGVSVTRIRYLAVVISGLTSGLAGAFLSIENSNVFTQGMTGGRGFIALAANISGGWNPIGSFLAALFFGFTEALQYRMQAVKLIDLPSEIFVMFPYIATVIAVAGFVRKSRPPKAVGLDFRIEKEAN